MEPFHYFSIQFNYNIRQLPFIVGTIFPKCKTHELCYRKIHAFLFYLSSSSVKKRLSAFLKYKMTDYFSDIPKVNPRRGWNFISLFVTTIRVVPSPPPFSDTPLIVFNATLSNVSFVLPKGR